MTARPSPIELDTSERHEADVLKKALSEPMPSTASGLDRLVVRIGRYVSVLFLLAVGFSFYEIIMRYVFNAPTIWVHETVIGLVAVCYAFGGAYAFARDSHIRISLLYGFTAGKGRKVVDILNAALTLLFAGGLGYAAFLLTQKAWFSPSGELSLDRSGSAWNPPTPAIAKALLLLCLVIMALQGVTHLISAIRRTKPDIPTDGGDAA